MLEQIHTDVLIAGGGMGGFMAAERARLSGARVVLLTGVPGASIRMAGFATALDEGPDDLPEHLFNDMFIGGGFVNNPRMLAAVVGRIGAETRFFEELGVPFVRQSDAADAPLARRQASGVSRPRAAYSTEMVGDQILKLLLERFVAADDPPVVIVENAFLVDIDTADGVARGGLVYIPSDRHWIHVVSGAVVLATGGCGRLYRKTTNFRGSTGMGYAMALEAGVELVDMEFVSFEPSVAVAPERAANMELPTMAFSDGARLLNSQGESFISTQPPASKDVMSRAIMREVAEGRGTPAGGVYFDMSLMEPDAATSYQQIRRILRVLDTSPAEARIEVGPTQHYMMGGIRTDENAATRVPGLFAVGEVAGGTHGAHRLATCGGTEVIAMGAIAGEGAAVHALEHPSRRPAASFAEAPNLLESEIDPRDAERLETIRGALERGCGVLRNRDDLEGSVAALENTRRDVENDAKTASFVGRASIVATVIATCALRREESRGDHFRTDFPSRDDQRWLGNQLCVIRPDGKLGVWYEGLAVGGRVHEGQTGDR